MRLGLRVKPSSRQLGTSVVYLGHQLLTKSCRLSLTAERRSALSEMIKKWFAYLREHRDVCRFAGWRVAWEDLSSRPRLSPSFA